MLFFVRLWLTKEKEESITTALMKIWGLLDPIANPPNAQALPHIRQYAIDVVYIAPPDPQEMMKRIKQRIYGTLFTVITTATAKRRCE
jgi:hypothetical protein